LDDNSNKISEMQDGEMTLIDQTSEYSYHSLFAKASYQLFSERLEPSANFRLSVASGDLAFTSQMLNLGAKYKVDSYTDIKAAVGFSNYVYDAAGIDDISELDMRINLRRRF